jgi:hypothetical protein
MRRRDLLAFLLAWPTVARSVSLSDECSPTPGAPLEPFAAQYASGGSTLVFIAAHHTRDLRSPTSALIRRAFESFVPEFVLVEGLATHEGLSPQGFITSLTARDVLKGGGESRYAATLAVQANRPFLGVEPHDREINDVLLRKFKIEDIVGSLVVRAIGSLSQNGRSPEEIRNYAQQIAAHIIRNDPRLHDGFKDFPRWYQAAYGISPWTDPNLGTRGTPCSTGSAGKLVKQITLLRNEHIALVISLVYPAKAKVLIVCGSGHFRALAKLLRTRYGTPNYKAA